MKVSYYGPTMQGGNKHDAYFLDDGSAVTGVSGPMVLVDQATEKLFCLSCDTYSLTRNCKHARLVRKYLKDHCCYRMPNGMGGTRRCKRFRHFWDGDKPYCSTHYPKNMRRKATLEKQRGKLLWACSMAAGPLRESEGFVIDEIQQHGLESPRLGALVQGMMRKKAIWDTRHDRLTQFDKGTR